MVLDPREHDELTYLWRGGHMHGFVWLGIVLLVLWAILWLGLKIASGVIHLLVLVAIVMIVWGLVKRGARAVDRRL
jgi:hypothetical protein